jgi:hypothetical protein
LVMMQLAETAIPSNKTAKKDEMAKVHSKLLVAKLKLDVRSCLFRMALRWLSGS